MSDNFEGSFKIYLRRSNVPTLTPVCRQVTIPAELIPVVNAHLFWLTRVWAWSGTQEESDNVINALGLFMLQLVDSECGTGPPPDCEDCEEKIAQLLRDLQRVTAAALRDDCDDRDDCTDCEDAMPCIRRIRVHPVTGSLQVSYFDDPCNDCWQDVTDTPLAAVFSNVGDYLLDTTNRAREAAKLNLGKPRTNVNQAQLRACAKATALVDLAIANLQAIGGLNSTWADLGFTLGEAIADIIPRETIKAALTFLLPEIFVPIVGLSETIQVLTGLSEDDMTDILSASYTAGREAAICEYSKLIISESDLIGEDLENLAFVLSKRFLINTEVMFRIFRSWDVLAVKNLMYEQRENLDCGCSQLMAGSTGIPAVPPSSDYDWAKVLDFALNDFSPEIISIISEPEGLQGAYAPSGYSDVYTSSPWGGWRRLRINITMGDSRNISSLDLHYLFDRGVLSENSPGSPLSNINLNFFFDGAIQKFTNTPASGVFRWEGLRNVSDIQVNSTCGYIETANEPVDPGGDVTYKKLIIRGLGTVPNGLASLPDEA